MADVMTTKIRRMWGEGGRGESAQHITHTAPKDLAQGSCPQNSRKNPHWSKMIFCNILGKIMV